MAEEAGWQPYNEDKPFGRDATVIGGDNIEYSKNRWEAVRAMREGRATPEQMALVRETDMIMKEAVSKRR